MSRISETGLRGVWTSGPGLSGSRLYLFDDGAFIYTEWADILPETIYDKGMWRASPGLLTLTPSFDVTWTPKTDRRYLLLEPPARNPAAFLPFKPRGYNPAALLLGVSGIDRLDSLAAHERDKTALYLHIASLALTEPWRSGESAATKDRLLRDSWRPCFFTENGCPHPTPECKER